MVARKLSIVFAALIAVLVLISFVPAASAATRDGSYNMPGSNRGATLVIPYTTDEQKAPSDFVVKDGSFNVPGSSRGPLTADLITRTEEHTVAYGGMTDETSQGVVWDASFNRPVSYR